MRLLKADTLKKEYGRYESMPELRGNLGEFSRLRNSGWKIDDDFFWVRRIKKSDPQGFVVHSHLGSTFTAHVFFRRPQEALAYDAGNLRKLGAFTKPQLFWSNATVRVAYTIWNKRAVGKFVVTETGWSYDFCVGIPSNGRFRLTLDGTVVAHVSVKDSSKADVDDHVVSQTATNVDSDVSLEKLKKAFSILLEGASAETLKEVNTALTA